MTTFSVNQSGSTVQISSTAAGFTQNSAYQYYLNSSNLSLRTDSFIVTFSDGASLKLTDFSEIPFFIGSSSSDSVVGIPATAEGGFTNSINLIGGYAYNSTFDIFDNISDSKLIDDYRPQGGANQYRQPYAQFGYSSGSLTVRAPRGSTSSGNASIGGDGLGSFTSTVGSYVGGEGGTPTPGSQYVSGGSASAAWIFSLGVPTPTPAPAPAPICFVEGTLIHIGGEEFKTIQELRIGDWIETARGLKRIKWVAKRYYPYSILKHFPQTLPVLFKKDSLGYSIPFKDLLVSPKHPLFIDGKAIGAGALVNLDTIRFCYVNEFPKGITYYHLEFDQGEVINAQGARSTTFISVGNRSEFDNASEYQLHYGDLDAFTQHNYLLADLEESRRLRGRFAKRAIVDHCTSNPEIQEKPTTSNKSSIPQSSTVTTFPAKSKESADAAF